MAAMAPEHAPHPLNLDSITALVHGFYADVRADPLLGPVFTQAIGAHWDAHLARMVDFWSTVALGSKRYRGNVAARHLALEGITPAHFAAWVRLWAEHTDARFPPAIAQQLQQTAHGVARNLFRVCLGQPPAFVQAHGHSH
jgi:hemoglobin